MAPPSRLTIALACCLALALGSLALPFAPVFDPWAWLVWGDELAGLDLDTAAGPSWKPLPVLASAAFAAAGDAAPDLWLALARVGWLAVPVLAWHLAARLTGTGPRAAAAGALAAAGTLLLFDPFTSWIRQAAGGLSEPLLTALVLGAAAAALERRPRLALVLAGLACLLRPEAWPFAAVYAWRESRAGNASPRVLAAAATGVAAVWFVPDLLAAGDALEGADRARGGATSLAEGLESLGWSIELAPAFAWAGAIAACMLAARNRDAVASRAILTLGAGATAWIALVAAMSAGGYAGLPRFAAPAGAVLCVLGGVGLVQLAEQARPTGRTARASPVALAVLAAAALAWDVGVRAERVPDAVERAADFSDGIDALFALADARSEALLACRPLAQSDLTAQTALAWRLDVPLAQVGYSGGAFPRTGTLVVGPSAAPGVRTLAELTGEPVASSGEWSAYRVGPCAEARGSRIAGVSGARR